MGTKREIILIFGLCILIYMVGMFSVRKESKTVKRRVLKNIFMVYFFVYICLLLKYTMFDGHFGREIGILTNLGDMKNAYRSYIAGRSNFNLFETIIRYISAYSIGSISLRLLLINILGNIVAFMPLALFLPIVSDRAKKFWGFFVQVFLIGLGIEVMQIALMTGSFDVDDILLNVLGALLAYGILHIKSIYNCINKLTGRNY